MPQPCNPLPSTPFPDDAPNHWTVPAPGATPPSKVWRICQGEPVAETNTGRLARDFSRLGEFLDRHMVQTLTRRGTPTATLQKLSARPGAAR